MNFINNTKNDSKIKIMDKKEKLGFRWITVKVGTEVDLPQETGERENFTHSKSKSIIEVIGNRLKKSTKEKSNKNKSDDKLKDNAEKELDEYKQKLSSINGIGARIVEDIVKGYPTEESLVKAIDSKEHLPFRNDIVDKLCVVFGKDSTSDDDDEEKDIDKTKDDE
ncbi:MAG: hypothetical protein KAK00_00505 [Nanoarchaeota archaeon]|nr:hypothetical protein [Nanoarchaeota archaeon]